MTSRLPVARLLVALLPVLAAVVVATPAAAATSGTTQEAVSENWAGYETTTTGSSGFSAASGSWVEPRVNCSSGQSYSALWVGLGGGAANSSALEQEGTQADCSARGEATYYAWYELVPSAPVKINVAIHPGDRIWARTAVRGKQVTVTVDNQTTGANFSKTITMRNATPDTSTAEWISEAPSACQGGVSGTCEPLPLADFGTAKFSDAYARAGGVVRSIAGWNSEAIALSPTGGSDFGYGGGYGGGFSNPDAAVRTTNNQGAAPGNLSSNGTAFSVTYGANANGAVSEEIGAGSGSGYGYGTGLSSRSGGTYGYGGYGYSGGYGSEAFFVPLAR